ncbi:hypothetical protein E2C01_066615 [Portunus trituberculatus]|uniref:Uncharacterized protein n=1 Tax=Portunus trituberculatus TaxID=210409 RepID=A0A5B7HV60_PORTR|nr:hypothetical protein [Portunus trituberculatus]
MEQTGQRVGTVRAKYTGTLLYSVNRTMSSSPGNPENRQRAKAVSGDFTKLRKQTLCPYFSRGHKR